MIRSVFVAALLATAAPKAAAPQSYVMPNAGNLAGCVEGRAPRVINGNLGCAAGSPPTLSGCGTGSSLSANATDFVGKITTGSGLVSSCTLVLSKLYSNPGMGCIVQSNSATSLALTPTVTNSATNTQVAIPLSVSTSGSTITYACFPV